MPDKRLRANRKPTSRKEVPTKGITTKKRNDLFTWWTNNDRNINATAKRFRRSRSFIYKIAEEDKWTKRAAEIDEKIKAGVDRKIISKELSNVKLVKACFVKEVRAYLAKPKSKVAGSIQSIVLMAQYLDEAEGNLPRDPGESAVPEKVAKALQLLDELSPGDIKQLADDIAKTRQTLEGNAG